MKKLGVSLLLVVVLATFGLGWMIDLLSARLGEPVPDHSLQAAESISSALARTLDQSDHRDAFVRQWNQSDAAPRIGLSALADFPLPPELSASFVEGKPLTLESAQSVTAHFVLPSSRRILSIELPETATAPAPLGLSLALTLLFYLGVVIFVLLWLLPLLQRLSRLRQTARAFGEGALDRRVDTGAMSYLGDIEREFNRMAQRIQTLVEDNKLLASAVSHDLRTPLARLRFGIDALSEASNPATRDRYQQHISRDIATMESLVQLLLSYARLEHELPGMDAEPVELGPLLDAAVERSDTDGKQLNLVTHEPAGLVCGNERTMRMLVDNLLHNALRHAKRQVLVRTEPCGSGVMFSVEDDGPGIPAEQRDRMFKPFVRGENLDSGEGHGLGLAIVARVAGWHQARIEIDESPSLGGARIRVHFPPTPI